MNQFRRITPDEVMAAYQATGLTPARTGSAWLTEDGKCGCGLAAMLLHNRPDFDRSFWFSAILGSLEISFGYAFGFIAGFEGDEPLPVLLRDDQFRVGFEDGKAAAVVVFGGTTS